jgi:starvation-inducible DNA-binding protein
MPSPTPSLNVFDALLPSADAAPIADASKFAADMANADHPAAPESEAASYWLAVFYATYSAYYSAQVGHWHIVDPKFNDIHAFFQVEYEELAKTIDAVAEHVRTHKALMPCCIRDLAMGDTLVVEKTSNAKQLLSSYLDKIEMLERLINSVGVEVHGLGMADDDLRGELARQFAKSRWKLHSMLESRVEASHK